MGIALKMTPSKNDDCRHLAEKILSLLAAGIEVDKTVYAYLASTFSNPSLDQIKKIILDESDTERDSLVDLLLFPDEAFQVKLEPFLTRHCFTRLEEERVIQSLSSIFPSVVIHLSAFNGHFRVAPTAYEVRQLVMRLNITWRMGKLIRRAIENHIAPVRQSLVSVRLRNADFTTNESGALFLSHFLNIFNHTEEGFFEYFDFLVDFLARMPNEAPYPGLMREKRRYFMALKQAENFQQQLFRGNMETLMLQGIRAPAQSTEYSRKKIALIDDIALALFGQTESVGMIYPASNMDFVRGNRKD